MTGSNLTLLLIGLAIGATEAVAGGLLDYILHLRRQHRPRFNVPGCLVYMIGALILIGIAAVIVSLITTGRIWPALVMGAGVMIGFYTGFMLLVGLWLLRDNARTKAESGVSPDAELPSDTTLP